MSAFLPIDAVTTLRSIAPSQMQAAGVQQPTGAFGQLVSDGIGRLNDRLIGDQVALQKLALGEGQNLHQLMIDLEETRLSFQLMLQVRSRLLEAYQDIMKMPI